MKGSAVDLELVSVVAPVYNEEAVIEEFVERTLAVADSLKAQYRFEVVLVDDGSRDGTLVLLKALSQQYERVRIIELNRNYGQTPALQAGIDQAKGDIIVTLDADLQHFPEEIPAFLDKLGDEFDVVCGWRHERAEGKIRRWPSKVANLMISRISGLKLHDFGTTFRACRAEAVDDLRMFGEFHRFVPVLLAHFGGKITEIPIKNIERPAGVSNYGLGRTVGVFLDLFVLYFFINYLDRPMRAFGKLGLLAGGMGSTILGIMVAIAYTYNLPLFRDHPGWFILGSMLLLVSIQMILAGILAEILIRIHYSQGDGRVYRIRKEW